MTRFRTLARVELPYAVGRYSQSRYALVEAWTSTGRRHQIRRHFKHIFHPLVGDTRYGDGRHNQLFRDQFGCRRLLLHALSLKIRHPQAGEWQPLAAPIPEDFRQILLQVGFPTCVGEEP